MNRKIKNIIFDYGGTLDTDGIHWSEKFWEVYQHFQIPVEKEDFRNAFIYSERNIADVIKPYFSLNKTYETQITYQLKYFENMQLLSEIYFLIVENISRYCLKTVLDNIEITKLTLALLDNEYRLGLVSNYYGNVETVLKEIDLRKYFKVAIDSTLVGVRKPDKKIFQLALYRLGANAKETMVVGDSYENDILPAKQLGCTTVWLNGKSWNGQSDTSSADIIINSLKELPNILKI